MQLNLLELQSQVCTQDEFLKNPERFGFILVDFHIENYFWMKVTIISLFYFCRKTRTVFWKVSKKRQKELQFECLRLVEPGKLWFRLVQWFSLGKPPVRCPRIPSPQPTQSADGCSSRESIERNGVRTKTEGKSIYISVDSIAQGLGLVEPEETNNNKVGIPRDTFTKKGG